MADSEKADSQKANPQKADPQKETWFTKRPWLRALLIWGGIGIALLFFGGIAAQGYMRLMMPCPVGAPCPSPFIDKRILWALIYLSVGGGVALGFIGVALTLSNPRGVGWGMGF